MDEEAVPLLTTGLTDSTPNGNSGDNTNSRASLSSSSARIPIYGTNHHLSGKFIPVEERLTYSWSEINVFTDFTSSFKSRFFQFGKNKTNPLPKKHILKNVCGVAYPGELLAILGSSGAGKSTLLNALTFQSPCNVTVSGIRYVNGVAVSPKSLTSQLAYVQQDDLFIGNLTVKEHLTFQALVRMDRNITYRERMHRVNEVITELALGKCQNTPIGIVGRLKGISGGEKKRLSFASEVLTNPRLMLCDEPTSGLDSFMALNVIQVLKNMTETGKTVICTIHQPSSELYSMFDKLLLMAEGRVAFLGSPEEADTFFEELQAPCPKNYNPADYFIQLMAILPEKEESSRQAVNLICNRYERSSFGVKVALEAGREHEENLHTDIFLSSEFYKSPYKASWCAQFRAVMWRSWLTVMKEPILLKMRLLQTILISLLLGTIYYGQEMNEHGVMNINGVLFMFLTNMTFQYVFAVINVFCSELQVFLREHHNGMYRTDVYFLCKTLAEAPIFIIIPIVFISVCYFMIGLNAEGPRFFIACGILVLVANVAASFGYLISCASSSVSMALSVGPPLIIPSLLFGGFFLNIGSIPSYFNWLSYLSWFRFGNEALLINQWKNVTNIECPVSNSTCPKNGHVVLEIYNFTEEDFIPDIIMLASLIVGFRLLAYFALLLKASKRK